MNTAPEFFRRHKISVTDYFRMGEAGILAHDARVELINGEIIDMTPIGPNHAGVVNVFTMALTRAAGDRTVVSVQNPLVLGEHSAPQPDLCVLATREDFYQTAHPQAEDVLLAIEVADSSLKFDTTIKLPLYAAFGVSEFWLFDVQARELTRYSDILGERYRRKELVTTTEPVALLASPDIVVDLRALQKG